MAKADSNHKYRKTRQFFTWLLITFGCLTVAGYVAVRWTEQQILTTDNWVAIVSPLPKNDQVASAVSHYTVTNLFNSIDLSSKVREALPERATFLAPTLTSALTTQSENLTKAFIKSDRFQGAWESANRLAHARLVETARDQDNSDNRPTTREIQIGNTKFSLNLASIRQYIREQLEKSGAISGLKQDVGQSQIVADLKVSAQNFKRFVRTTDALYAILPFITMASFLLALALAVRKYIALLGISIGIMLVTTLQIIGLKILRPEIINMVQNNLYRPAAGVVWDSLVIPFNNLARDYFIIGLILGIITIFFGPAHWAVRLRRKLRLTEITKASAFDYVREARYWVDQQKKYIWIGLSLVALIYLAFATNINWISALKVILTTISAGAIVELFASNKLNRVAS